LRDNRFNLRHLLHLLLFGEHPLDLNRTLKLTHSRLSV
jgi:hypothetical protein